MKHALLVILILSVAMTACLPADPGEQFIQGKWTAAGDLGDGHSWYLEWTFANGAFAASGYPPLEHKGKYRLAASEGDTLTLELYDQEGDWPTEDRSMTIIIDTQNNTLTIDGQGPFSRSQ